MTAPPPEVVAEISQKLIPGMFQTLLKYASEEQLLALFNTMFSPEMTEKMSKEMLPEMMTSFFEKLSDDKKAEMIKSMISEEQMVKIMQEMTKGAMPFSSTPSMPRTPAKMTPKQPPMQSMKNMPK